MNLLESNYWNPSNVQRLVFTPQLQGLLSPKAFLRDSWQVSLPLCHFVAIYNSNRLTISTCSILNVDCSCLFWINDMGCFSVSCQGHPFGLSSGLVFEFHRASVSLILERIHLTPRNEAKKQTITCHAPTGC